MHDEQDRYVPPESIPLQAPERHGLRNDIAPTEDQPSKSGDIVCGLPWNLVEG